MSSQDRTGPRDAARRRRTITRLRTGGVVVLASSMIAAATTGCWKRPARPVAGTEQAQDPPPALVVRPPDPPPRPSEADLAAAAAVRAESRGLFDQAAREYERAARAAAGGPQVADLHWALAQLWADPVNPARDLEKAKLACSAVLESRPSAARAREARSMLSLLDDLDRSRVETTSLKNDLESAKVSDAALKDELRKKDQELENIKKVLLEKKP